MLDKSIAQFTGLRSSLKSLILLFWIYALAGSLIDVFIQLFLYQKFTSIPLNVAATLLLYTGIMIGFCLPGYIASIWKLNIKRGFFFAFLVLGSAILYLLHTESMITAFVAVFLWGAGEGIFWLTVNTFELSETKDHERDVYSSLLTAGSYILTLLGPALATLLIWLSESVLHFGTYTLLFTVAPFIYFLGFFCFQGLKDYRPGRIVWADIAHFLSDKRNQAAQLYTLGSGFQHILGTTVPPLVILALLGTVFRVGIYETILAALSVASILVIAQYRTPSNRLLIFGAVTLALMALLIWFGYTFTFTALVIYTIAIAVLKPLHQVSLHIISLNSMELGRKETDFYPTMLLRELFLWIWRMLGGLIFLFLMTLFETEREFLSVGLYLIAVSLALTFLGAYLFLRKVRGA